MNVRYTIFALFVAFAGTACSGDGVSFRGDAHRSGISSGRGLPELTKLAWKKEGFATTAPASHAGRIYLSTGKGELTTLDAAGEVTWSEDISGGVSSTPAFADGVVYFGSRNGAVRAISLQTRESVWDYETNGRVESSPLVTADLVVVGSDDGYLHAIERTDGVERWRFEVGEPVRSAPAIVGDRIVFSAAETVYAVNVHTGQEDWKFETAGDIHAAAVACNEQVAVIANEAGHAHALFLDRGQEKWKFVLGTQARLAPVLDEENVYFAADAGVTAIAWRTGQVVWRSSEFESPTAAPVLAGDVVYVGARDGHYHALEAADGKERWKFKTEHRSDAPAVVESGRVYLLDGKGTLYALE